VILSCKNICKASGQAKKLARLCLAVQDKEMKALIVTVQEIKKVKKGARPIFLMCVGRRMRLATKTVLVVVLVSKDKFLQVAAAL